MAVPAGEVVIEELEAYRRRELTGYCYRMLGAGTEAEHAVQETLRVERSGRGLSLGCEGAPAGTRT